MNITLKYFGLIAEVTNQNEEVFDFSGNTVSELLNIINSK